MSASSPLLRKSSTSRRERSLSPSRRQTRSRWRSFSSEYPPFLERIQSRLDLEDVNEKPPYVPAKFPPLIYVPSWRVWVFGACVAVSVTLCVTVFNDWLAERANMDPVDFRKRFLSLASIPIANVPFTFAHIYLCLYMTFFPLTFIGCWQIPGTNMGFPLGWQGIVPFKAEEMAIMAVSQIKENLLRVDEVFARTDPSRVADLLKPSLSRQLSKAIEVVASQEIPALWGVLPSVVKDEIKHLAEREGPNAVARILHDMEPDIEEIIDLDHLIVELIKQTPELSIDIFLKVGYEELGFIRDAGAVFGGLFGLVQMGIFIVYPKSWVLPVLGFVVGAITNWFALLMCFSPLEPKKVCGLTLHGRFLARQADVSVEYGKMVHKDVLTVPNILHEMLEGKQRSKVEKIVERNVRIAIDNSLGPAKPFASYVAAERLERVTSTVSAMFNEGLFDSMMEAEDYLDRAWDLERTLRERMAELPYAKFERLLHPVFEQDEPKLILVGGVLGVLFGVAQIVFVF